VHLVPVGTASHPVRLWSAATLDAVAALPVAAAAPTLWEAHGAAIAGGLPLPVVTDAAEVARLEAAIARFDQPLPPGRGDPPRVGVHRLLGYHACPRQYWLRYVLHREGTPTRTTLPAVSETVAEWGEDTSARADGTTFGRLMHGILQVADFTRPPAVDEAAVRAAAALLEYEVTDADVAAVRLCLDRLAAGPLWARLGAAEVCDRELRFLIAEDDVLVPGIMDVLARTGDDWWVVDYKTGRPGAAHMRQVALYALGATLATGRTPTTVTLAYLDLDGSRALRTEPVDARLLDDARGLIRHVGAGLRRGDYGPKPGHACAACPFLAECPDGVKPAQT
jgi:RecB family exonuclease